VGLSSPCLWWWARLCRRRCAAGGCARAVLVWGGVSWGYTNYYSTNGQTQAPTGTHTQAHTQRHTHRRSANIVAQLRKDDSSTEDLGSTLSRYKILSLQSFILELPPPPPPPSAKPILLQYGCTPIAHYRCLPWLTRARRPAVGRWQQERRSWVNTHTTNGQTQAHTLRPTHTVDLDKIFVCEFRDGALVNSIIGTKRLFYFARLHFFRTQHHTFRPPSCVPGIQYW